MTAAVAIPVQQNTPAWLDARRDLIGASDIPIITGSSIWQTSLFSLWAIKTRLAEPEPPDEETQELFDLGHALEPVIAERYTAKTGRKVRRVNQLLRHPTIPYLGASLDRISAVRGERRIVELKYAPHRDWAAGPEPIPGHVQDQVQAQMFVTGIPVADVAVLAAGRVDVFTMEADPGYQADLALIAYERFWRYVEAQEMPPIDGSEATRRALASLANRRRLTNGVHLDARHYPDLAEMATRLRAAQVAEKAAKGEVGTLKNAIGAVLLAAEAWGVDGDGWRIDWHQNASSEKRVRNDAAIASLYRSLLESIASGSTLSGALRDAGLDPDAPELFDAIEGLHTTTETREGARPMRLWVKSEESGRWQ